jgi:predicted regulator of Ras-like GTPase activity (Roadblock/LC7/MglB family)
MASGENAVLTALARKDAKLGLIFLDMKRTSEEVAKVV